MPGTVARETSLNQQGKGRTFGISRLRADGQLKSRMSRGAPLEMTVVGVPPSCQREDLQREYLAPLRKNRSQLLRRDDFELGIGTVARLLVCSPPAKLRDMAKAASLHVVVSDFHYQFGA